MIFFHICRPISKISFVTRLCTCRIFNASRSYVISLGILGVVLSLLDLCRILRAGPILPCTFWRNRIQPGRIVSPECERDLKLLGLVCSLEYYALLIYGIATDSPAYLLPILWIFAVIIVVEFLVFLMRMYVNGLDLSKNHIISSMFVTFHWIIVYCAYHQEET